ncbi:MAG: TIGR02301 family protein [Salaquimonas sp.]
MKPAPKKDWLLKLSSALLLGSALLLAPVTIGIQNSFAQETAPVEGDEAEAEAEKPVDTRPQLKTLPPAYDEQMLRLAEVLGALHYLRELCGANEGQTWREEMEKLLAAEEPTEQRRAQLIAHFNRGFRGYAEIYRECTKPASEAANQFLQQGMRLAAEIPNRFGR